MRYLNRLLLVPGRLRERGSALLVALMVMVGLSLLGLAFVAVSETESAISVNEKNRAQAVGLAESGAKEVVQWFQSPPQAETSLLMPLNSTGATWFKTQRVSGAYSGYYKSNPSAKLCDLPYGPLNTDLFFGNEASADIKVTRATSSGQSFLDTFNTQFIGTGTDPRETGEITEIRVFAPPIQGGNLVVDAASGNSFWVGGSRLGVATIAVRVDKFDKPLADTTRRSIATATCRIVVGKFPLPIPMGPLQAQTSLTTNGNFDVNWGLVSSELTLNLKKDYATVPWVNAYEQIHYERGYDSSFVFVPSAVYVLGDIVRPTAAAIAANAAVKAHEYLVTAAGTAGAEPAWPTTAGTTIASGGVTFKERFPTAYPIANGGSAGDTNRPWLWFIATGTNSIQDPWFESRSAADISGDPAGPQPFPFPYSTPGTYGATHHFQFQSFDQYPSYRRVVFPDINYDFWKATAQSANGQGEVHYLFPSGANYTDGVTTQSYALWTARGPGYYFFDTTNQLNPQNGGPGTLAAQEGAAVQGFVYLNAPYKSTGCGGGTDLAGHYNQPGEPYEDIGYRQVALVPVGSTKAGDFITDAAGQANVVGAFNKQWDFQDLPWSNTGSCCSGTKDGKFNLRLAQHLVTNPAGGTYTGWFPVAYYPGCNPGDNSCASCNCSEPHEPYLNLIYDGSSLTGLKVGWENPASPTKIAKITTNGAYNGTLVDCSTTPESCTSNAYDKRGGMVPLTPHVSGVLYIEGVFDTTGNCDYYGSVLVGAGGVDPKGTPKLWYDESLRDGSWLPPGLPRVLVTSVQTDQN